MFTMYERPDEYLLLLDFLNLFCLLLRTQDCTGELAGVRVLWKYLWAMRFCYGITNAYTARTPPATYGLAPVAERGRAPAKVVPQRVGLPHLHKTRLEPSFPVLVPSNNINTPRRPHNATNEYVTTSINLFLSETNIHTHTHTHPNLGFFQTDYHGSFLRRLHKNVLRRSGRRGWWRLLQRQPGRQPGRPGWTKGMQQTPCDFS